MADFVGPVREFLDRRLPPQQHRELLGRGGWDPAFWTDLAALGWTELTRPERDGGLGNPLPELRELLMLVGERLVPGPLAEQLVVSALVPGAAGGRRPALADPGVGTGWSAGLGGLRLVGGELDGCVELVRFGAQAEALVFAVDGGEGEFAGEPAVVVLGADDPAVTVEPLPSTDPVAPYARVTVHRSRVRPDEGTTGAAARTLLLRIRAWMRLYTACELAGISARMLADTVTYVRRREQFGRPVASFQAIKHLVAGMAQRAISLDALCEAAVADAAEQDGHDLSGLELTACTAKAYAAQSARQVCEDALQAHGGIGFTTECDLHWYLRRTLALRTWYGDERELTALIGARRLAAPAERSEKRERVAE